MTVIDVEDLADFLFKGLPEDIEVIQRVNAADALAKYIVMYSDTDNEGQYLFYTGVYEPIDEEE